MARILIYELFPKFKSGSCVVNTLHKKSRETDIKSVALTEIYKILIKEKASH